MGHAVSGPRVVAVRALVPRTGQADLASDHWLTRTTIASPMGRWPAFRSTRASWGIDAVGTVVVEVELSDGHVGVAPTLGGVPAAHLVEHALARFVEGRVLDRAGIAEAWDQMFTATMHYGRRGLAVHAVSAVDLALWDALGRSRGEPVWSLLGGREGSAVPLYATGPRPDVARQLGFVGGKLPLPAGAAEGEDGLRHDVELATRMREACGDADGFFLAYDCWMSLDVPFAVRLAEAVVPLGFRWLEECLPPDDYWGQAKVRASVPSGLQVATGEHEATRWGFRMLLEMGCADVLQPDPRWCGGLSEMLEIAELAQTHHVPVVPHASSVHAYHFLASRPEETLGEFFMLHPDATEVVPVLAPLLVGEPLPVGGEVRLGDEPGFGVELNRSLALDRPFPR